MRRLVDLAEANLLFEGEHTFAGDYILETGAINGLTLCYQRKMLVDGNLDLFNYGDGSTMDFIPAEDILQPMGLLECKPFRFTLNYGIFEDDTPMEQPKFYYTKSSEARQVLLTVVISDDNYRDWLPQGIDSEFGKQFRAVFYEHRDATAEYMGCDFWVLEYLEPFRMAMTQLDAIFARREEAGDLFFQHSFQSLQIYTDIVRHQLLPRVEQLPGYELKPGVDYALLTKDDQNGVPQPQCIYRYTQNDTLALHRDIYRLEHELDRYDLPQSGSEEATP